MHEPFAEQFYGSIAWQRCRKAYTAYRRGLCEVCLEKGIYTPGEIVHHKKHITPATIDDPDITLNWDNLQLVCRDCHAKIHFGRDDRRYKFDAYGRLQIIEKE